MSDAGQGLPQAAPAMQPGQGGGVSGLAIASLVIGILSLLFSFIPLLGCLGIPGAIVGVILGAVAWVLDSKRNRPTGMAKAGLALNVLAVVVSVVWTTVIVSSGAKEIDKALELARDAASGPVETRAPDLEVEAVDLVGAYGKNEIQADAQYKDKVVLVRGVVSQVSKDLMDQMHVTLEGGDPLRRVQCFFPSDAAAGLAALQPGGKVAIKGRVAGLMVNVLVKGCSLQK